MDLQGLLANFAGALFLAPRDMRKRLAKFVNRSFHPGEMLVGRDASRENIMADSRASFVPRGVVRGVFHLAQTLRMGLVPVYVYDVFDGVSWVPYPDMFEKFGHVLNIGESEFFVKDLIDVCIAELEAKEAMASKVRDIHFSFWESCVKAKGFRVQNHGIPGVKCERCRPQSQELDRLGEGTVITVSGPR